MRDPLAEPADIGVNVTNSAQEPFAGIVVQLFAANANGPVTTELIGIAVDPLLLAVTAIGGVEVAPTSIEPKL
jgi:hypothetical protein